MDYIKIQAETIRQCAEKHTTGQDRTFEWHNAQLQTPKAVEKRLTRFVLSISEWPCPKLQLKPIQNLETTNQSNNKKPFKTKRPDDCCRREIVQSPIENMPKEG